jgi:hypothetical protein
MHLDESRNTLKATLDDLGFTSPITLPEYPNCSGVYVIIGENDKILYIGSSKQLCRRSSHITALQEDSTNKEGFSHIKAGLLREYQEQGGNATIRFLKCDKYKEIEKKLIAKYSPPWNKKGTKSQ